VLITNYEVPEEFHGPLPDGYEYFWDDNRDPTTAAAGFKLPQRRSFAYARNRGYDLTIANLPWERSTVDVYRIDDAHDLTEAASSEQDGGRIELRGELPPPGIDLVVVRPR
jgi:hypothetical protein